MSTNEVTSAIPATAARKSIRQRLSSRSTQKTFQFYLFIAPWLLGFIFLVVLPLAGGLAISVTNYDGLNLTTAKYVGLKNYARIFSDRDAMYSLGRVLVWTALNTPLWIFTSFLLAYLLNHAIKGRGIFRTLFYLPSVIPLVAGGLDWTNYAQFQLRLD